MKKSYFVVSALLQLLCYVGAWLMQHFTARKMGMLRWVNGVSNKWSNMAELDAIHGVLVLLVAAAVLLLLFGALDKGSGGSGVLDGLVLSMLFSAGAYVAYTLAYTRKLASAYYLVSPLLLLAVFSSMLFLLLALGNYRSSDDK